MLSKCNNNGITFKWLDFIKDILIECGLTYLDVQGLYTVNIKWLKELIKQILNYQYQQTLLSDMHNSSKKSNYKLFKKIYEVINKLVCNLSFVRQYILYNSMLSKCNNNGITFKWLDFIKDILIESGLTYLDVQGLYTVNIKWLKELIKQILNDQYQQTLLSDMHNSSKKSNYKLFKKIVNLTSI